MRSMVKAVLAACFLNLGSAAAAENKLPIDVVKYIKQREGCDHFRGEMPDPPDEQRMKKIEREIRKLCMGTDNKLERLKRKYATNRAVLKPLNEFEEKIE